MAQIDILRQFNEQLDQMASRNEITTRKAISMQEKLVNQQKNMYTLKKKMYESDYKGLNMMKRFLSVGKKIVDHQVKIRDMKKNILTSEKQIININKEIDKLNKKKIPGYEKTLKIFERQREELSLMNKMNKVQLSQMKGVISAAGLFKFGLMGAAGAAFKIVTSIGLVAINLVKTLINVKQIFKTFLKIQSITGSIAADIGLTREESKFLLNNMANLTISASKFGGTIEDIATIYKTFSESTNKNRLFNADEVELLTELGLGTSLGVQGATELAGAFDNIGISLTNTIKLTDKARNLAARYNVNTGKVLKTYQQLVTSLTGIGFGKGLDNLAKLAAKATAIRFDIAESTSKFIDAFFDLNKATETAAQMQVLGGKFAASFGDPIQLAFESINDPAKLAEKFSQLMRDKVIKRGNEFIISPADRQMLKIAAEQLGQSYEDVYRSSIEQAKTADKIASLTKKGLGFGFSDDDKTALGALMNLNDKGKYEIRLSDGTTALLENVSDNRQLQQILSARKSNEKSAIERKNLMERLQLIVDRFTLGFSSVLTKLFGGTKFDTFLGMVENAGTGIATLITKHFTGSDGLINITDRLMKKALDIFSKIESIWGGKDVSFLSKIGDTLKLLLKDVAIDLIQAIFPFIKAGIGSIMVSMKDIPFIGKSLANSGIKMQQEMLVGNQSVQDLYGPKMTNELIGTQSNQFNSIGQATAITGKGIYQTIPYAKKMAGKGLSKLGGGMIDVFGNTKLGELGLKTGMVGEKMAAKTISKRIPVIGSAVSFLLAYQDLMEGDLSGTALNVGSGLANLSNLILPGVGSAISLGLDGINTARELGAFNNLTPKTNKSDMTQFIDQMAYEKANNRVSSESSGSNSVINHTGVITIKSEDGKVVTWDQMYNAAGVVGGGIQSSISRFENGYGTNLHPNQNTIRPLL